MGVVVDTDMMAVALEIGLVEVETRLESELEPEVEIKV